MVGVSLAHDVVEGQCFSLFAIDFVDLIVLLVVFGANDAADSYESVKLITTPNTLLLELGPNPGA